MDEVKLTTRNVLIIALAAVFIVVFLMFGFVAVRSIAAMILIFFVPYYFILKHWIETGDAVILSLFVGIGITPILIYYLNMIIPSLKITIFATAALLYAAAVGVVVWKRKK